MIVHPLEIQVLDAASGAAIPDARVSAERYGKQRSATFHPDREVYFFPRIAPGFYRVCVEHPDHERQERSVQVHFKPTRESFLLGAKLQAARAAAPAAVVAAAPGPPGGPATGGFLVGAPRGSTLLRQSYASPASGPLLPGGRVLTPRLFVRFRPQAKKEDVENLLPPAHYRTYPIGETPGLFLVERLADLGAEDIQNIKKSLNGNAKLVHYAESVVATRPADDGPPSSAFLRPGAWDRRQVGIEEAWELLAAAHGEGMAQGRPELIVSVIDSPLQCVAGEPLHPDFRGMVSNQSRKVVQLFDFDSPDGRRDQLTPRPHGTQCAGIAVGRSLGVAPNCRLLALGIPSRSDTLGEVLRWTGGLHSEKRQEAFPGFPDPLEQGADILLRSGDLGDVQEEFQHFQDALRALTRRGRRGKGCLLFFSAGNQPKNVVAIRRANSLEGVLSCAASTRDEEGMEIGTPYSGFGEDLDWCAPSSSHFPFADQPPRELAVWTADLVQEGDLPSVPWTRGVLQACTPAESTRLALGDGPLAAEDFPISLGRPGSANYERIEWKSVNGQLELTTPLRFPHCQGEELFAAFREVGLLQAIDPRRRRLQLDPPLAVTAAIEIGDVLQFDSLSQHGGDRAIVLSPPDSQGWVTVDAVPALLAPRSSVFMTRNQHSGFGATSAAAALCAGVGALVLSANPDLTWIEARQILRETASKGIGTDDEWSDEDGSAVSKTGKPRFFSRRYGHGRLDAKAAVTAALDYRFPRDLLVRRAAGDDGLSLVPWDSDSPDIWVRRRHPLSQPEKALTRSLRGDPERSGPHENPQQDRRTHWIHVRVTNRGTKPSYDAWVRFAIASLQKTPFAYPEDWGWKNGFGNHNTDWDQGTYFLDEVGITGVPAGASQIINLPWPAVLLPPWKKAVLLVEVSPHDGPLHGRYVRDNNNLAQKFITIEDPTARERSRPRTRARRPG